jgi:uncharacterized protein
MEDQDTYTAFEGDKLLCRGLLGQVVLNVKRKIEKSPDGTFLIFSDATGKTMDFNLQGSESEVLKRLQVFVSSSAGENSSGLGTGPGRPKLGVISREVSLLPRHWEWLANQSGGASATLRKLVEEARKKISSGSDVKRAQERTYKFMSVVAGNLPGFEEALRALYRKEKKSFMAQVHTWPRDVRDHAVELAKPAFAHD